MHKISARRLTPVLAAGICLLNLLPTGAYAPPEHPCLPAVVQDTPPGAQSKTPEPQTAIPGAPPGSPTAYSNATVFQSSGPAARPQNKETPFNENAPNPDGAVSEEDAAPSSENAAEAQAPNAETEGAAKPDPPAEDAKQPDRSALLALVEQGELTEADLDYLLLPNGRLDRLDRYSAWAASHPDAAPKDVVLQVNLDQDRKFYQSPQPAAAPDSLALLVNKHYALSSSYTPQLEALGAGYGSGSLRPEAAAAFRAMADAAQADGISLCSVSAYRSYQRQASVYSRYLSQDWQASVDTYSARPGHSEHQTGLALDINTASLKARFEKTPAYAWLTEHCAQYGFILRYPKGKENITGYRFEPWHYRYVGAEIAKACMEQDLTLEEYLALQPAAQPKIIKNIDK